MAVVWRSTRYNNENKQAGEKFIGDAKKTNVDGERVGRSLYNHLAEPGKKSLASIQLDTQEETLKQKLASHEAKIAELEGTPWAHLETANKNLVRTAQHVSEAENSVATRDQLDATMRENLRLLRAAGRIDQDGNILDTTGLNPEFTNLFVARYQEWKRVDESSFSENQPDVLSGYLDQAREFQRQIKELEPMQYISASTSEAKLVTAGEVPDASDTPSERSDVSVAISPVSVDKAVQRPADEERPTPRTPPEGPQTKRQGPGQK